MSWIKIKSYLGWEIILFVFVNLIILFNSFYYLNTFAALNLEAIYEKIHGYDLDAPANFLVFVDFMDKILPIFLLLKYLILPVTIWTILKWGKNNKIINLIKNTAQNYGFQLLILFIAFILDIVYVSSDILINSYIQYNGYYNYYWNSVVEYIKINLLFTGGLTSSYLVIFLLLLIYKKFRKQPII